VLHVTEAYSSLDQTKLKYNITRMLKDEKENVIVRTRPNDLKSCENTGLLKKKYILPKIYFTSTIEHMVTCYI
jgi:hypothetical protein